MVIISRIAIINCGLEILSERKREREEKMVGGRMALSRLRLKTEKGKWPYGDGSISGMILKRHYVCWTVIGTFLNAGCKGGMSQVANLSSNVSPDHPFG